MELVRTDRVIGYLIQESLEMKSIDIWQEVKYLKKEF